LVIAKVEVAIGQAQTALVDFRDLARRVGSIGTSAESEKCRDTNFVEASEDHGEVVGIARRVEHHEIAGQRRQTLALDRGFVHARRVEFGRLARISARGWRRRLEQAAKNVEIARLNFREAPVRSSICWQRIARDPPATRELIEVGARIDLAVERSEVDSRWRRHSRSPLRGDKR
jgi:hypothetical protein